MQVCILDVALNRCYWVEAMVGAAEAQGLEGTECPQNIEQQSIMVPKSLGSKSLARSGKVR